MWWCAVNCALNSRWSALLKHTSALSTVAINDSSTRLLANDGALRAGANVIIVCCLLVLYEYPMAESTKKKEKKVM